MRREEIEVERVPLRADGTPKRCWYDPAYPSHIVWRCDSGKFQLICIGH